MSLSIARECGIDIEERDDYYSMLATPAQLAAYESRIRADQRGRDAKLCELSSQEILLMAGELTAPQLRAVGAVLKNRAAAIRSEGAKP